MQSCMYSDSAGIIRQRGHSSCLPEAIAKLSEDRVMSATMLFSSQPSLHPGDSAQRSKLAIRSEPDQIAHQARGRSITAKPKLGTGRSVGLAGIWSLAGSR